MKTQVSTDTSPRRPTVQFYARQLAELAHRRGHSLESLVQAVQAAFVKTKD